MPRTRRKLGSSGAAAGPLYQDYSTDEEDLYFDTQPPRPSKRGKPTGSKRGKSAKKKKTESGSGCHNSQCGTSATAKKRVSKKKNSQNVDPVVIDCDEEVVDVGLTEAHVNTISSKVNDFFKTLESDDDGDDEEVCSKNSLNDEKATTHLNKSKEFYMVLTDSEEEQKSPESSFPINPLNRSSPAILMEDKESSIVEQSSVDSQEVLDTSVDLMKKKNLFAYIDDILNDITKTKLEKSQPKLSLDDLKKKKDEILGDVGAQVQQLQPKEQEPTNSTPVKVAPVCPVCLEHLGGSTQAMVTLCGHMFCKSCIVQIVQKTKKCPSCRKGLTKSKYHPVYI